MKIDIPTELSWNSNEFTIEEVDQSYLLLRTSSETGSREMGSMSMNTLVRKADLLRAVKMLEVSAEQDPEVPEVRDWPDEPWPEFPNEMIG